MQIGIKLGAFVFYTKGNFYANVCFKAAFEGKLDINFALLRWSASAPPVDVVATQSSSSPQCREVSWSPPSSAAPTISGYKIFYGNGQSVLFLHIYVTHIVLNFVDSNQIESVSICSESTQLPSELITATVTTAGSSVLIIIYTKNNASNNYYVYSLNLLHRWSVIINLMLCAHAPGKSPGYCCGGWWSW